MMHKKPCPVDRGKLLIGLECCRANGHVSCRRCPYLRTPASGGICIGDIETDALAYIDWLEEQVKEATENAGND